MPTTANTKNKVQLQLMDIKMYPEGDVNVKQESKLSLYSCDFANILKKVDTNVSKHSEACSCHRTELTAPYCLTALDVSPHLRAPT